MPERRKHKRYATGKHLKVFNHNSKKLIGLLANISSDGAMFVTGEKIKPSPKLKCRLELMKPIMGKNVIIFDAHQRWSRKNVARGWWESGYQIEAEGINSELILYLSISFAIEDWKIPGVIDVNTTAVEDMRESTRYEVKEKYPVYQKFRYNEIGKLVDISQTGVAFITKEPIKRGAILNCKAKLPLTIFQQDYLFFDAECMWCKEDKTSGMYKSGYKLQNVSEQDKIILLYLIQHFLEVKKSEQKFNVVH